MRSISLRRSSKVPNRQLGKDVFFVDVDGILKKVDPDEVVTEVGASSTGPAILAHGTGPPQNGENTSWLLPPGDSFPFSGTFRITFNGDETTDIDVEDTQADVQAKLEALPSIGPGNIIVTGNGSDPLYPGGELDFEFTGDLGEQDVDLSSLAVTNLNVLVGSSPHPADPDNWVLEFDQSGSPPNPPAVVNIYVDDSDGTVWVNTAFGTDSPNWIQSDLQSIQNLLAEDYIPQGGPLTETLFANNHMILGVDALGALTRIWVSGELEAGIVDLRPGFLGIGTSETDDNQNAVTFGRGGVVGSFFKLKNDGRMFFETLATEDPNETALLWNDSGVLSLSNGDDVSAVKSRRGVYEGSNVLIPNGDNAGLDWSFFLGSEVLDLTDSLAPIVLVDGLYFVRLSILCEALTSDGSYQVHLNLNPIDANGGSYTDSPLSKTSNLHTPRVTVSDTNFIPAGGQITVDIKNKDGVAAVNFSIFRAIVVKL